MKCKHSYIKTADMTGDLYCPLCDKRARQGVLYFKENTNHLKPNNLVNENKRIIFGVDTSEPIKGNQVERAIREIAKSLNNRLNAQQRGGKYE